MLKYNLAGLLAVGLALFFISKGGLVVGSLLILGAVLYNILGEINEEIRNKSTRGHNGNDSPDGSGPV